MWFERPEAAKAKYQGQEVEFTLFAISILGSYRRLQYRRQHFKGNQ
jgi:hypothetical protein